MSRKRSKVHRFRYRRTGPLHFDAWDAISARSAFISALSGKYQVLLRTDCTTLERTGRHAETALHHHRKRSLLHGLQSDPPLAEISELQVRSGVSRRRQIPQRFHWDSRRLPARHCCDECHALALFTSIAEAFRKAHEFRPRFGMLCPRTLIEETPRETGASAGFASRQCDQVLYYLGQGTVDAAIGRTFRLAHARWRSQRRGFYLETDFDFTNSIRSKQCHHLRSSRALRSVRLFGWVDPPLSRSISTPLSFGD